MGHTQQHAFTSPGIYGLDKFPGLSNVRSSITVMQTSFSIPNDKGQKPSVLSAQENSSNASPHQSKAYPTPPKGKDPHKVLIASIINSTIMAASAIAVAPIERICVLMQCQNEMIKAGHLSIPYKGVKDCFSRTIKNEGVLSLWRGNSVNVIRLCIVPMLPLALALVPYQSYMAKKVNESRLWMLPFAVMPMMLWYYPLEYARVRLACDVKAGGRLKFSLDSSTQSLTNDVKNRQFTGVFDVVKKTLKSDGIRGLYRGYAFSCVGLLAYSTCLNWVRAPSSQENGKKEKPTIVALALPAVIVPVAFFPVRTLSRRMMMTSGEASKYKGGGDAFYQIVKTEGVSSLFRGVTAFLMCDLAKEASQFAFLHSVSVGLDKLLKSR